MARSQLHVLISSLPRGVNCYRTRNLLNSYCKTPSDRITHSCAISKEEVELVGGEALNPVVSVQCLRFPVHY